MPGSITSVFGEAKDFEAALCDEGCLGLLVTGRGTFRARLTRVTLQRLRLSAGEESLPRIAFIAVPADTILISLARGREPAPIWGGIRIGEGEIMTLGAGQRLHTRTDRPCRWGSIWLPVSKLVRYGTAMTGAAFPVPTATQRRQLRPAMIRNLRHLHSAGIDAIERRSNAFIDGETAHGLEQQLIEALVECLSNGAAIEANCATRKRQDVVARFEALLQAPAEQPLRMAEICSTLRVSAQTLRLSCAEQLGMGPAEYVRRRAATGGRTMKVL
jgi:hypothetical protein